MFVFEGAQWAIFLGPKSEQNPTKSIAERGCGGGCQTPEVGKRRQETTSSISRSATHGVGGQPGTDTGDPVSNQCKVKKKCEVERQKDTRHGTRHMLSLICNLLWDQSQAAHRTDRGENWWVGGEIHCEANKTKRMLGYMLGVWIWKKMVKRR